MLKLNLFVPTRDRSGKLLSKSWRDTILEEATELVFELGGTGGTVFEGEGFYFGINGVVRETVKVVETYLNIDKLTPHQSLSVEAWAKAVAKNCNQESVMYTLEPTPLEMHFIP